MKNLLFAGMLVFAATGFAQDENDLKTWMKTLAASNGAIRKNMTAGNMADVAKDAKTVAGVYKQSGEFFAKNNMQDAVDWSKTAETAANDLAAAATAGDAEKATASAKVIGGSCMPCHAAHREKTETGYKIK